MTIGRQALARVALRAINPENGRRGLHTETIENVNRPEWSQATIPLPSITGAMPGLEPLATTQE